MPAGNSNGRGRTVAPAVTTGVGRNREVSKGTVPTRDQRLSRLAVVLAEQAPMRDAREDEDDPWPDIPEELEPIDDDAIDDDDQMSSGRFLRHPLIVYSRAANWAPPAGAVAAESDDTEGDLRVTVRDPQGGPREHDPGTLAIIHDELHRIAAALDRLQGRALMASTRVDAVASLTLMSQRDLAVEAGGGVDEPKVSRRRRAIIEAPWGQVPLEFFWWRRSDGLSVAEARELIAELRRNPTRPALAIARCVAEAHSHSAAVKTRADAIRHQVPQMDALLTFIPTLNMLSHRIAEVEREELHAVVDKAVFDQTGVHLNARGAGLVRLGLAGAFEGIEVTA